MSDLSRNHALRVLLASHGYAAPLNGIASNAPLVLIHMETDGLIERSEWGWRLTEAGIARAKEVSR